MKGNHDKCHLLLSSHEDANIQIANVAIKRSTSKNLLGVAVYNKLKIDKHVENIFQKASRKLNALARLVNYMDLPERRILINAFLNAQFNYCPTIWMLYNRSLNKINSLHECCWRKIYNDKQSNFEEVLVRDNSVSIHHQNIQSLAIQMYIVANSMSPDIMSEISQLRENTHYHLRYIHCNYGIEIMDLNLSYLWPKIWELIPLEIKTNESLAGFKKKIKKWKPNDYPCRLCKVFISNVDFI